ncbi:AGE family epimerase/isomerase [Flavitalea flava]
MDRKLADYKQELEKELQSILRYWMDHTIDDRQGGFYGRIDGGDRVHPEAPKGVVLNARILWAFSAAYLQTKEIAYLPIAQRAYRYLTDHFVDPVYGGVYWSVDHTGNALNDRKQIYGLSFCIYGFSEYYRATLEQSALDQAIALFRSIERISYDPEKGGYFEAFTRDWQVMEDMRLSPKDANEKKTMNTHLHVVEAYANLYRVWPDPRLQTRIGDLLEVFDRYMVDRITGHLVLFFDENWKVSSRIVSYGHDIEAAWLLLEAAEISGIKSRVERMRQLAIKIAVAAVEGLDQDSGDGGLWYEREHGRLVREKHSWPQAEAMVGFFNAFQVSGDEKWLERSLASWAFVKKYIKDPAGGEWFWGIREDHSPMTGQDKAGFWKCPYHNSRACLEIIKRINLDTSNKLS